MREVDLLPSDVPDPRTKAPIPVSKRGRPVKNKSVPAESPVSSTTAITVDPTSDAPTPVAPRLSSDQLLDELGRYYRPPVTSPVDLPVIVPPKIVTPSVTAPVSEVNLTPPVASVLLQTHLKFGHLNAEYCLHVPEVSQKIPVQDVKGFTCTSCDKGKSTFHWAGRSFPTSSLVPGHTISMDSIGAVEPQSINKDKFFYRIVDAASGYCMNVFLKDKRGGPSGAEAAHALKRWIADTGRTPSVVHTDSGPDFISDVFPTACQRLRIKLEQGTPGHHNDNGQNERSTRTLWQDNRTYLLHANADGQLWNYASQYATYVRNRCPSRRLGWKSPYEVFYGSVPDSRWLHPWGCKVYITTSNPDTRMDATATPGVFLGVRKNGADYCFIVGQYYNNSAKAGLLIRHATDLLFRDLVPFFTNDPYLPVVDTNMITSDPPGDAIEPDADNSISAFMTSMEQEDSFGTAFTVSTDAGLYTDPKTHKEAMARPSLEAAQWRLSEDKEWIDTVMVKAVAEAVDYSEVKLHGGSILPTHFVYKLKPAVDNVDPALRKVAEYKCRTVVGGHREHPSNIGNTFAPTVPIIVFRLLISIYMSKSFQESAPDIVMRAGDVSAAFCSAAIPVNKRIYIKAPLPKYEIPGKVFLLKSALYGLKEAPRLWNGKLVSILLSADLQQSSVEPCLFYSLWPGTSKLCAMLITFVDDILYIGPLQFWKEKVVPAFDAQVTFKDLGKPSKFLGMEITETDAGVYVSQTGYIDKMLERFGMDKANPVRSPMENSRDRVVQGTHLLCDLEVHTRSTQVQLN